MSTIYTGTLGRLQSPPVDAFTQLVTPGEEGNIWQVVTNVWATCSTMFGAFQGIEGLNGFQIMEADDGLVFLTLAPQRALTNTTYHWEGRYNLGPVTGLVFYPFDEGWDIQVTGFIFSLSP
jgi:hypothetical protein